MGNLYFVRHGQTIWNVENKICGATDIALTELGHEQAIETGRKILEMGIKADEIRYSPLVRAKDTALHIAEITGIHAAEEPRLIEQNFGKYESTPRNGADFQAAKRQFMPMIFTGGTSLLLKDEIIRQVPGVCGDEITDNVRYANVLGLLAAMPGGR